jgi:hypothetical protein
MSPPLPLPTFSGGTKAITLTPVATTPPEWWAEARIPLDDTPAAD